MSKTARVIYLLLLLTVLYALNWFLTGAISLPSGDSAIWLHGGLLMLVIGVYWIEPFFTKPADVVINGLVVFISISTLNNPPLLEWWTFLKFVAVFVTTAAFVVIIYGTPGIPRTQAPRPIQISYLLATRLGSARVLFSATFLLALLSYFDLSNSNTKWFAVVWAIILLAKELNLGELIDGIVRKISDNKFLSVGKISRFVEPNIVRFSIQPDTNCNKGSLVAFTRNGLVDNASPIGFVTGHRRTAEMLEGECIIIDSNFNSGALDDRINVVSVNIDDNVIHSRLDKNSLFEKLNRKIGYASEDSDISHLNFEITGDVDLEEGHLVAISARNKEIYFQITNATLKEESIHGGSKRAYTSADAEQVGMWNADNQGFVTYSWVSPENSPVFHITRDERVELKKVNQATQIGEIPNSIFPVYISLPDLVLYHSAILGVTGAGKTFLAFDLIEKAAASGIKVICLDMTGDYKRHLVDSVMLTSSASIEPFLNAAGNKNIGIVEFTEKTHPIVSTSNIALVALRWCESHRTKEDFLNPKAKVFLVMEEAHTLVPEWNFNPARNLQDTVNQTAQTVLQARKYGLGFCIITQRTANVTKSILNQCNTIFSFQAFDETGFDFLKNYMGHSYVAALPNLRHRYGVLVGKASCSTKPLIVRFKDQIRSLQLIEPPSWEQVVK